MRRRIKEARFPSLRTSDTFEFERQPRILRDRILELARGDFVEQRENMVLIGEIGTGKACRTPAIDVACSQGGYRIQSLTAADLTTLLVEPNPMDRLSRKPDQLARLDVFVIDELTPRRQRRSTGSRTTPKYVRSGGGRAHVRVLSLLA